MPLAAGARIGPYEVLSPLGAGGMGEVYRAHDTRLARDVTLKVLPAEVAQDKDRLKPLRAGGPRGRGPQPPEPPDRVRPRPTRGQPLPRLRAARTPAPTFSVHGLVPGAGEETNLSWFASSYAMDLSFDGSTLLLGDWASAAGVRPLFLRPTDGSPALRLGDGFGGRISPDKKWVAAVRGSPNRIVLLPTGAGQARELPMPNPDIVVEGLSWFPDGRRILGVGRKGGPSESRLTFAQDLEGGPPQKVLEGYVGWLASPDDRPVLAQGKGPFLSCPVDGGACRSLPSLDPEVDWPERFSPDGRTLMVASTPTGLTIVFARMDLATGRHESITTLTPAERTGVFAFGYTSIAPDGRYYVYSLGRSLSDLYLAKGLR